MEDTNYDKKSGFVAILGRPNVGKSTLMNHLIGQKIAIVSKKAQTTRKEVKTVWTEERGQIVFLDTPGMLKAENRLGEFMLQEIHETFKSSDAVVWIVEPVKRIGRLEDRIIQLLSVTKKPIILVVNKCDEYKPEAVEAALRLYQSVGVTFRDTLAVSALRGTGLPALKDALFDILPYGPMYYDEETVTEETEREIAAEMVREAALRLLDQEVPHGIAVEIEEMHLRDDGSIYDISASIICEKKSHKGIIIGKEGSMIKRIGRTARIRMEDMLETKVNLQLRVKVREDWRNSDTYLKEYGYKRKR